jgi:hypothetical protein
MFAISMHASAESGTDSITATVARGLPRKDHNAGQHQTNHRLVHQLFQRQLHKHRLIEDDRCLKLRWNVDELLDRLLHSIDDGDGVAVAALFEDGNIDRALAVDADDVVLQSARIDGVSDISNQN